MDGNAYRGSGMHEVELTHVTQADDFIHRMEARETRRMNCTNEVSNIRCHIETLVGDA